VLLHVEKTHEFMIFVRKNTTIHHASSYICLCERETCTHTHTELGYLFLLLSFSLSLSLSVSLSLSHTGTCSHADVLKMKMIFCLRAQGTAAVTAGVSFREQM